MCEYSGRTGYITPIMGKYLVESLLKPQEILSQMYDITKSHIALHKQLH